MDFQENVKRYTGLSDQEKSLANRYSLLRGLSFIVLGLCTYKAFETGSTLWISGILVSLIAFIFLISRHKYHQDRQKHFLELININQEEILRKSLQLTDFNPGDEYIDPRHPFASDLDIFGRHSLFQLVNRTAIQDSQKLLIKWLTEIPKKNNIHERQMAIKELSGKSEWVQNLQAALRITQRSKRKNAPTIAAEDLINWSKISNSENISWIRPVSLLLNLTTIIAGYSIWFSMITYHWFYLVIGINGLMLWHIIKSLNVQMEGIDQAHYMIKTYAKAIDHLLSETFDAPILQRLQLDLQSTLAHTAIKELSSITQRVNNRANMLYMIVDLTFVTDAYLYQAIVHWKKKYQNHITDWLEAIHKAECLTSLASFAIAESKFQYPTITDQSGLKAIELGHPLIPAAERIINDYHIAEVGSVDILTGSNMSGKSTFQRTLGINMVLAYVGLPVCAKSFETGIFQIFTSMRTKDDLESHTSSFYAELKRIQQMLNGISESIPTFFLLDEILKGTNSEDRHIGAEALVKKLSNKNSLGLISTHDLALGRMVNELDSVRNFSFNSSIEGDKIIFDYKLTEGICKSFNASQLMRNMGILDAEK